MADGEIPVEQPDDEPDPIQFRQAVQQITELINNNARAHREIPDLMQWRLQRIKTIRTLKELRKKLDLVCVGANYGKGAGSVAQLSGAITSILGAIMALGKSPSASTVMNAGSLLNNSGALVGGLSNIVESFASAEYLREIRAILDKDKELSQPLQEWLVFSQRLDTNIEIILGSDLNSAIKNNVLNVFSEFTTLYNSTRGFHGTLEAINSGQYSVHIGTDVAADKLLRFSKKLDVAPELRDTIIKLNESVKLLQVAKDGVKVYQNLFGENSSTTRSLPSSQVLAIPANDNRINTIQDDGNVELVSNNNSSFQTQCPSVSAVSAFCAFQAIDIAACVVSLTSAAMVIKDGKSKFSDAIKQLSDLLEAEFKSIDEIN